MGSSPGRVKPKTIKLVFVASSLSRQHEGVRETSLLGSEYCVKSGTCLTRKQNKGEVILQILSSLCR